MRRSAIAILVSVALALGGCGAQHLHYASVDLPAHTVLHTPVGQEHKLRDAGIEVALE